MIEVYYSDRTEKIRTDSFDVKGVKELKSFIREGRHEYHVVFGDCAMGHFRKVVTIFRIN